MRGRLTVAVTVLALVVAAAVVALVRWHRPSPTQVPASVVRPITLPWVAPTYVARRSKGLVARAGDDQDRVGGWSARWLPGGERGRVLVSRIPNGSRQVVYDVATGARGAKIDTERTPGAAVTRVDLVRRSGEPQLESLDLDLGQPVTTPLPAGRTWDGQAVTVGDATFVRWSTSSSEGWRRVGSDGKQSDVLTGQRIIQLSSSTDGAALLGIRQPTPPSCAGCLMPQQVVEVNPLTGVVMADYGVPDAYDPSWRVTAVDKVGRRIAVCFASAPDDAAIGGLTPSLGLQGTWIYDGDWSMVPASRTELTWWQGPDDRVVARADVDEPAYDDGLDLLWLHRGDPPVALPGELNLYGTRQVDIGQVPGALLPPV